MGKKGKLLFKGDKRPKKKSKKSKTTTTAVATESRGGILAPDRPQADRSGDASSSSSPSTTTAAAAAAPTIREGTGTITTSGTVVTGHGTKFRKEVSVGDALMVRDQLRVVTMCLSDGSLNLSSAFSENLRTPAPFRYVRKPRDEAERKRTARQKRKEAADAVERSVFDIYGGSGSNNASGGGGAVFTYREKTETGSYRVRKQAVSSSSSSTTRGDLLDLRSKKTSDKYC